MNNDTFNKELEHISGGRQNVRTPQFMGQQKGFSIDAIRALIKKQKRAKGYTFSVPSGTSDFNLNLSGTARIFLGFSILLETGLAGQPDNFNFQINNEIIVDQVPPAFFSPDFMDDEYYYFPRPLSGTDELKISFQNSGQAQNVRLIIYYI